jgi:hypothetical protein
MHHYREEYFARPEQPVLANQQPTRLDDVKVVRAPLLW